MIIRYVNYDLGFDAFDESLSLADIATGSEEFTNSNEVEVTAFPVPEGYTQYQITESGEVSAVGGSWISTNTPPTIASFAQPSADTNVTLYAWYTNTSDTVELIRGQGDIYYTTVAPPNPPVRETLSIGRLADQPVVIAPDDLDEGASGGEADGRALGIFARRVVSAVDPSLDETPAEPYLTLAGTQPDGDYPLHLWVQNEAGNATLSSSTTLVTVATAADTNTWTGAGATDLWDDEQNWDEGVPLAGQHVVLGAGAAALLTNSTPELASFTLTDGMMIFSNWMTRLRADTVDLQGSAELTLPPAFAETEMSNRVWIVCGDFTLGADALINVDYKGYKASQGPGGGGGERGAGGSYGGRGGAGDSQPGQPVYGSVYEPLDPGSGGAISSDGGAGGGAVLIQAGGTVAVHGTISANGQRFQGWRITWEGIVGCGGGGGSGGSIFIDANVFDAGAGGLLRANGGRSLYAEEGYYTLDGGGSGGRIALAYTSLLQGGAPAIRFATGSGAGRFPGDDVWGWFLASQWGTLSLPDETLIGEAPTAGCFDRVHLHFRDMDALALDNLSVAGGNRLVLATPGLDLSIAGDLTVDDGEFGIGEIDGDSNSVLTVGNDLVVTNGSILTVHSGLGVAEWNDFGARVVVSNEFVVADASWVHPHSHRTDGGSVHFAAQTLTVADGGGFNALGRGYAWLQGPAPGIGATDENRGAGHGGRGGANNRHFPGAAETGSLDRPMRPGSGGAIHYNIGGDGGGLITIEAVVASLSGSFIADGARGPGGAAGGGIVIDCETLAGQSPLFRAGGGAGGGKRAAGYHGGGGGGRIALHYQDVSGLAAPRFSTPPGAPMPSAVPVNWWGAAGEGTVWCSTPEVLAEVIDGDRFEDVRFFAENFEAWTTPGLTVSNSVLTFGADGFALTVEGDLTLGAGGVLGLGANPGAARPSLTCDGALTVRDGGVLRVYGGQAESAAWDFGLGATVDVGGALTIETGGWIYPFSHDLTAGNGGSPRFRARSLTVGQDGGFNAKGLGCRYNEGEGAGNSTTYHWRGSGGGYGGRGGDFYDFAGTGGAVYGLAAAPLLPGSGGGLYGWNKGFGGNGGGLIWLEIEDVVQLDGVLDATGNPRNLEDAGGGSGGGILVSARNFAVGPTAELRAQGGYGGWGGQEGGGGGGGRIALWREVSEQRKLLLLAGAEVVAGLNITDETEPFQGFAGQTFVEGGTGPRPGEEGSVRFVDGRPKATMIILR